MLAFHIRFKVRYHYSKPYKHSVSLVLVRGLLQIYILWSKSSADIFTKFYQISLESLAMTALQSSISLNPPTRYLFGFQWLFLRYSWFKRMPLILFCDPLNVTHLITLLLLIRPSFPFWKQECFPNGKHGHGHSQVKTPKHARCPALRTHRH